MAVWENLYILYNLKSEEIMLKLKIKIYINWSVKYKSESSEEIYEIIKKMVASEEDD